MKKFSKMQIECGMRAINNGTTDQITVDGLVDAARCKMGKRKSETRTIYGRIVKVTDRAVLFAQTTTHGEQSLAGNVWWPLSQVELIERAMGPLDGLLVRETVLAEKFENEQREIETTPPTK